MDQKVLAEVLRRTREGDLELVCDDERGKIWRLEIEGKEYILIYTVKNEVRGGDYHQSKQHDYVLKGRMFWIKKVCLSCPDGLGEDQRLMREGEEMVTDANVPHMMISLGGSSLVLEWLEGGKFEKQYYKPFRDKIEAPKT